MKFTIAILLFASTAFGFTPLPQKMRLSGGTYIVLKENPAEGVRNGDCLLGSCVDWQIQLTENWYPHEVTLDTGLTVQIWSNSPLPGNFKICAVQAGSKFALSEKPCN